VAKATGIGWTTLSVDDSSNSAQAIKNDITNLTISTPRAVQDTTGIDKSAIERLLLLADLSLGLNGVFNAASNMSHDVFKTVPSTSVARAISMTVNAKNLNLTGTLLTDYQLTRAATGELTWAVPVVNGDGSVPTWS
jgi:hypothetical protein